MGFFDDMKKKAQEVINSAYNQQKEIIRSAQDQASGIVTGAYDQQKKIIREAQDEAEKIIADAKAKAEIIINDAYEKQKELIADGVNKISDLKVELEAELSKKFNSALSYVYDLIVSYLRKGNWWMQIAASILEIVKDKVLGDLSK